MRFPPLSSLTSLYGSVVCTHDMVSAFFLTLYAYSLLYMPVCCFVGGGLVDVFAKPCYR